MVEEIIAEHTERFHAVVPVARRRAGHQLARRNAPKRSAKAELERLFARCPELTERERMLITGMSLTIISKLLHTAITSIRDKALVNRAEALDRRPHPRRTVRLCARHAETEESPR